MTDFEDRFQARLSQDDEAFLRDLEAGQGFFTQLLGTFRGPLGWVSIMAMIFALVCVGLAIWFGWEAFHAPTDREVILWCTGAVLAFIGNGLLRIWLLNRMSHLVVLREIKKVELQLAKIGGAG